MSTPSQDATADLESVGTETKADDLLTSAACFDAVSRTHVVLHLSPDGRVTGANSVAEALLGRGSQELRSTHVSELLDERGCSDGGARALAEAVARRESPTAEHALRGADGRTAWVQGTFSPITSVDGSLNAIVFCGVDITAERTAARENGRLARALHQSGMAVMMVDRDLVVTYVNEQTVALLESHLDAFRERWPSLDPNAMVGVCIDAFHTDPARQRKLLSDPANLPFRTDIQIGSLSVELSVSALRDENGEHVGSCLEWQNVNELRALDAQKKAIDRVQAVIEFTLDGTIECANKNFLDTVGYELDEVVGKHHRIFVEPEYATSDEYREFWSSLQRGEVRSGEFRRFAKDGSEVWIQASYNPILDLSGQPVGVVKFATDITERKHQEHKQALMNEEISSLLDAVRDRELTRRARVEHVDGEQRRILEGMNELVQIFASTLGSVSGVTTEVSAASSEISQGSQKVAEGASNQASSIEEISASLEEMSSMTAQNADNASEAQALANSAKDAAGRGDVEMAKMKEAIDAIKSSSDETAKIVKTIDQISFQTNMLALNAAVEAARAGDAGKGFAVVAEEVRSLAQRSAEAAKNTAQLIEGSSRNVDNGVVITEGVQRILSEITDGSSKVRDLIAEIAAASKEQAEGIGQITTAVDQVNTVTQENAANSEQSSAAASELENQVRQLTRMIGEYSLGVDAAPAPPAQAPATAAPAPGKDPMSPSALHRALPLDDDDFGDF